MPPRRGAGVCIGQERLVANAILIEEIRHFHTRMEEMEISQREPNEETASAEEEYFDGEIEEDTEENKVLRILIKASGRPMVEVPMYKANLNVEELMDKISSLDKYFDFEEVEYKKKVKFATTRIKGHATLWWDDLQASKGRNSKPKIKNWDKVVRKIKSKFMLKDYQIIIFKQLQNLRQKGMRVKEYTEEFYKLNIRAGHTENNVDKVARYINGLSYDTG